MSGSAVDASNIDDLFCINWCGFLVGIASPRRATQNNRHEYLPKKNTVSPIGDTEKGHEPATTHGMGTKDAKKKRRDRQKNMGK